MPSDYSSGLGGADFGSRLLSNVYALHRRDQDLEREDAQNQRNSMLRILEATANSGNVNSEDMPTLIKTLFETASAKPDKKAIESLTQHAQELFGKKNVTRKGAGDFGPAQQRGGYEVFTPNPSGVGGETQSEMPAFTVPGVPTSETVQGPAVRLMTPEQKTAEILRGKVAERQALQPFEMEKLRETYGQKRLLQQEKMTADQVGKLAQINARTQGKAQQRVTELAYAYEQQGYDPDSALQLAGKAALREFEAGTGVKESQTKVNQQRVLDMQGRLVDMTMRTEQIKRRTDAYIRRMDALNTGKGASAKANVPVFNAMVKELSPELTALNRMVIKLKTDPDVDKGDPEIQQNIAALETRIGEIRQAFKDARDKWLPNIPLPDEQKASPAASAKGTIRRSNLQAVRDRNPSLNGMSDDELIKHLASQGYVVK